MVALPSDGARMQLRAGMPVGLALVRDAEVLGAEPFFHEFIAGMERVLTPRGVPVLLQVVATVRQAGERIRAWAAHGQVQGTILIDLLPDDERVALVAELEMPTVVIGDPANPDLTAKKAIVQVHVNIDGSVKVFRIAATGVRLNARLVGGKVSFGQIDKLLPPPSGKPFTLPDLAVDIDDTAVRLDTPFGRLGFALVGRGNLSGGFRGRLAASGPHCRRLR